MPSTITTSGTPTPIPIFAPLDSVPLSLFVFAAAVDCDVPVVLEEVCRVL